MGTMKKSSLILVVLLAGCELRGGLTRSQLHGGEADAGAPVDVVAPPIDVAVPPIDVAVPPIDVAVTPAPDGRADPPDAAAPDRPMAPPEGIFVTGVVRGICDNRQVMIGGAGYHTCSYAGKGSYRLRIRDVPPGTRVELAAKVPGYLPSPATVELVLKLDGNTHDFEFMPASGSCDRVPDAGPCVCVPPACDPS
jgi:hypothetical protein